MKLFVAFSLAMVVTAGHHPLFDDTYPEISGADLARAKRNNVPHNSPLLSYDDSGTSVASHLNQWLVKNVPGGNLVECESFASHEGTTGLGLWDLNHILETLVERASPALQEIYKAKCDTKLGCDKRTLRYGQMQDFVDEWQRELQDIEMQSSETLRNAVFDVLRNGKCYEAVQIYYHSLTESAQIQYMHTENNVIPMLPKNHDAVKLLANLYLEKTKEVSQTNATGFSKRHSASHLYDQVHGANDGEDDVHLRLRGRRLEANSKHHASDGDAHRSFFKDPLFVRRAKEIQESMEFDTHFMRNLLMKYSKQSPCELAHRRLSPPWTVESAEKAGVSKEVAEGIAGLGKHNTFKPHTTFADGIPDTTIPDAGYISCDAAEQCLAGGNVQYMIQAVVRTFRIPGSGKILKPGCKEPYGEDIYFQTRTFEAIPGSPSPWGPDAAGGDGTAGLLGPALLANPGDKVHVFVANNLGTGNGLGPDVPTAQDFWDRIEQLRRHNSNRTFGFAPNFMFTGPEWSLDTHRKN